MIALSDRQKEILSFIRDYDRVHGQPPTRAEICEAFGFRSPNAAEKHLRALVAARYLELPPGRSRNIRLRGEAIEQLPPSLQLPLIGRIAAGSPVTASQNIDRWLPIDPGFFRPRADFLYQVAGDSMEDVGIQSGDLVGIHAQPDADSGQIVAAIVPDPITGDDLISLKELRRQTGNVSLVSKNRARNYPPIVVNSDLVQDNSQDAEPLRIAGIYVGLIRAPESAFHNRE